MVAKKRKSKRQTLQQKYKIIKRCKEHHKKLKKGKIVGSTNQLQRTAALKRSENRIPNAWPYKEELLQEIESAKDKMEKLKEHQSQKRKEEMMKRRGVGSQNLENSGNMVVDDSTPRNSSVDSSLLEQELDATENSNNNLGKNSRRAFLRDLRKVIETSDIVIHVLDARDPIGTKSRTIEEMVANYNGKKLIFVLNKCDLVPKSVLEAWLRYLRQFYPTIPFKCSTQSQKHNLGSIHGKLMSQSTNALQSSTSLGSEELLNLLKNYCRIDHSTAKSIITVGIVGFPNVGKSSLINSLMRIRAVGVSGIPGFTKNLQEVVLDKNIRLIDSPGVVFADGDNPNTALRNCVNVEDLTDVLTPIQAIVRKCPAAYLMQIYSIPAFADHDCNQFLALVAKSLGKLKKGGVPNLDAAARAVLHDWNQGKIKYYCKPPLNSFQVANSEVQLGDSDDIANDLSGNANSDGLFVAIDAVVEGL